MIDDVNRYAGDLKKMVNTKIPTSKGAVPLRRAYPSRRQRHKRFSLHDLRKDNNVAHTRHFSIYMPFLCNTFHSLKHELHCQVILLVIIWSYYIRFVGHGDYI
jgi:hypothetical protein